MASSEWHRRPNCPGTTLVCSHDPVNKGPHEVTAIWSRYGQSVQYNQLLCILKITPIARDLGAEISIHRINLLMNFVASHCWLLSLGFPSLVLPPLPALTEVGTLTLQLEIHLPFTLRSPCARQTACTEPGWPLGHHLVITALCPTPLCSHWRVVQSEPHLPAGHQHTLLPTVGATTEATGASVPPSFVFYVCLLR